LRGREAGADRIGQAGRFAAEDEPVAALPARVGEALRRTGREGEHPLGNGKLGGEELVPRAMA
jgi:hypothetical protein